MKTFVLGKDSNELILGSCKSVLLAGTSDFILVPTETVYGLACVWDDDAAKKRICQAKIRPEYKPFQMLVNSTEMAKEYGCILDEKAEKIAKAFCPGPITLIVPSASGAKKTGFRIPEHKFVLALILELKEALAATSANISGEPPSLNVRNALSSLKIEPALAIDGGQFPKSSVASTVVEIENSKVKILREGPISLSAIMKAIG